MWNWAPAVTFFAVILPRKCSSTIFLAINSPTNETAEGRALNRRVELHMLEQEPAPENVTPRDEGPAVE